ncbi:MAG: 2Fe-2S iron-sulfur cluster-binding protein [Bdellovibrionota bacterium]
MPRVSFPGGSFVDVPIGTPLAQAVTQAGYEGIGWGCCQGICGTCRFQPGKGADQLTPPTALESILLNNRNATEGERLACHVTVQADLEVLPATPEKRTY